MSTNDELKTKLPMAQKPVLGEVSFNVATYSLLDKDVKYCHWSEGLNMIIEKNGVTVKLNSEEIQQIVKSLPRTIGGCY
jgi:hypothetical protein